MKKKVSRFRVSSFEKHGASFGPKAEALKRTPKQAGMTLIESMIVVAVLIIVIGAVFEQISKIYLRFGAEETKLDLQQSSRETLDQFTRDLHQAGTPNQAMYDPTLLTTATWYNATSVALRLVKITPTFIQFEGDVDGTGTVSSVIYEYADTSTESVNCPCILRSQVAKANASPLSGQTTAYHVIAENVATNGLTFTAYNQFGNSVNLGTGIDIGSTAGFNQLDGTPSATQAVIKSIGINLSLRSKRMDGNTHLNPTKTLSTIVELKN
jgi:type II secretory pathway pseudopilin PulG